MWKHYTTAGKPILEGRNETTRSAFDDGAELFWFLDDDIYPPPHALERLVGSGLDIVSGVCTTKVPPVNTCFAHRNTNDCYSWGRSPWSWPGPPFFVDVVGMGCILVKRKVLETIGPDDWFRWDWPRTFYPQGVANPSKTIKQAKGEDVWFCEQATKQGFQVHVDPDVRCEHRNRDNGRFFPGDSFWESKRTG
jgi:hypothetical protein